MTSMIFTSLALDQRSSVGCITTGDDCDDSEHREWPARLSNEAATFDGMSIAYGNSRQSIAFEVFHVPVSSSIKLLSSVVASQRPISSIRISRLSDPFITPSRSCEE